MVVRPDGAGALAGSAGSASLNRLKSLGGGSGRISEDAGPVTGNIQRSGTVPAPAQYQQPWQGPNVGTVPWAGSEQYNQQNQAPYQAPSQQAFVPEAPPAPRQPVQGGREWYNSLDAGGKQSQDNTWLAGDSDYTAQNVEYERALQSFVDRIANQRKSFTEDATLATASTNRNQEQSLNNLGEDFGARGLSYSGMFDTTKNQTNERFNEAKGGIERIRSKNDTDAVNRETDYRAENTISKSNASRASLGRQAQRQALLDSGAF